MVTIWSWTKPKARRRARLASAGCGPGQASSAADAVPAYCDDLQGVRVEGASTFSPCVARRFYAAPASAALAVSGRSLWTRTR